MGGNANPKNLIKKGLKIPEKIIGTGLKIPEKVIKTGVDLTKDAVERVVEGAGSGVKKIMEEVMPMPQFPDMPMAADAGASAAETRSNQALIERDRADRLRRRRGRAATQLVQPSIAAVPAGSVATKSLLGQ